MTIKYGLEHIKICTKWKIIKLWGNKKVDEQRGQKSRQ